MSSVHPSRTRLVDPELAARVPAIRSATIAALVVGALSAACTVVQAVAMATAIDRSLLHHVPLVTLRPELIAIALAVLARAAVVFAGERWAERTAEAVVSTMRRQLLRQVLSLGPGWLVGERPGELSLTATRGLRSLHTYFARYLPQAAAAVVIPVVLLAWIASQDWLSLVIVVALVIAVPITMIHFGREANRRTERQWRRLGSLAGRFLQLIEGLPTLRAFGRDAHGRREVIESTEGVRVATMRTLRVAFLSALSMDLIAGFGVGFVAMALGLRLLWGELDLQTAMTVLLVTPEIFIPLRRAGAEFHASTEGQAAATRVVEILALDPDVSTDSTDTATGPPAPRPTASHLALLPRRRGRPSSTSRSTSSPSTTSASTGSASPTKIAPPTHSRASPSMRRPGAGSLSSGPRDPANRPSWPRCSGSSNRPGGRSRSAERGHAMFPWRNGGPTSHGCRSAPISSRPHWPRTSGSGRPRPQRKCWRTSPLPWDWTDWWRIFRWAWPRPSGRTA